MFSSRFDTSYLLIALAIGATLLVQAWLIRRRRGWLGGIVPTAYLALLGYLVVAGRLTQFVDWVFAALGLFALVTWWAGARRSMAEEAENGTP